ncbi:MAG TPA: hypothetical protein VLA29_03110 [Acidimicrobiia bacterium]|nr:hypothetical protein [Acidimicrobiia bacterium]
MGRLIPIGALLAFAVIASGCASPDGTPTSESTTTTISNVGGDVEPVQRPSEVYPHDRGDVRGTLVRETNGCWTIDTGAGPLVVVFPIGTSVDHATGVVTTADGFALANGETVEGVGGLTAVNDLPGAPDGFWSNYLGFCDPVALQVLVVDEFTPIDSGEAMTDEELVALLTDATLAVSWPCGLGFTLSDEDQGVAIYVYPSAAEPPTVTPVVLPDPGWEGSVVLGTNLLVNHCDDVVEPHEPVRVETAVWPIIGGTIDFEAPSELCGAAGPIEATLRGLVVAGPLGSMTLPDLDVVNTAYGCFAG